ncbi:MAG: glycosyltransferase family 39 protein [Bacteroidetes bacterium]|nr:glycosyltransferase family 39 protein [Bacteroidota bacterium]
MAKGLRTELLIVLAAIVLFMPGLGAVHLFDWDEINFAEIAREMIATGDYMRPQVDYQPFWEKPPLFMWMQAGSMRLFGVGEFAARFPDAVCGVVTLLVLYRIGRRLRDHLFGLLWVLAYGGSILPHLYFRSGIIDPWFNLFIFLGIHAFILLAWSREEGPRAGWGHAALSGLFLGLATLTKGPTALLILGLTAGVYWAMARFRLFVRIPQVLLMLAVMVAVCFSWFGVDWLLNGSWFLDTFVKYQVRLFSTPDAGHGGFPGYHFVVLLIGCFPASLFLILELVRPTRGTARDNDYRRWMVLLFWVVLILFTIVKSKIVHYSSMCYFPLTYLAALKLQRLWRGEEQAPAWLRIGLGGIGSVFALVTLALPFIVMQGDRLKPFIADPFGRANLDAAVHWTGQEALAGVWMVLVLFFGHRFFSRADHKRGLAVVFGGTALFVTITLFFFINNIEGYSQRAAITFFEQRQGERCYVVTKDYRSYAQLFYTRKPPVTDTLSYNEEWLYHGPIDRPVYLSTKITSADEARAIGTFREIGAANGFVFFRRDP